MKMIVLRRNITRIALLATLALPGLAAARDACDGTNMLPQLEAARPGAVAAMRAAANAHPNAEGRFWRVEAPGLVPSYLFGTFHGTAQEGAILPAPVLDAIRGARTLFIEISDEEQAAMQAAFGRDVDLIADRRGGTLDAALTPELRAIAARILPDYGLSYAQANVLRPWFLQIALATPPCAMAAMAAGATVLDDRIAAAARDAGVPVMGMETWQDALNFLITQPQEEAREGLALAILFADRAEDLRRTTADLWASGQMMMIWELSRTLLAEIDNDPTALDEMWDEFVVARNAGFLAATAADLDTGGAFIAVGGLHLPTADGMVEGLRAKGFAVSRIPLP